MGERFPVFRVELGTVNQPHADIPEFFQEMLGYKFYAVENGIDKPFRRTDPDDEDERYWDAMRVLARDIAQMLRQMKNLAQPAPVVTSGPVIYLAETDDLIEKREEVKTALQAKGVRVQPASDLPRSDLQVANQVREALWSAALSIHMIGRWGGRAVPAVARPLVPSPLPAATAHRTDRR